METITMTAEDVAARDLTRFRIVGGRVWYESACFSRNGTVRLSRVSQTDDNKLRQIDRYVDQYCKLEVSLSNDWNRASLRG